MSTRRFGRNNRFWKLYIARNKGVMTTMTRDTKCSLSLLSIALFCAATLGAFSCDPQETPMGGSNTNAATATVTASATVTETTTDTGAGSGSASSTGTGTAHVDTSTTTTTVTAICTINCSGSNTTVTNTGTGTVTSTSTSDLDWACQPFGSWMCVNPNQPNAGNYIHVYGGPVNLNNIFMSMKNPGPRSDLPCINFAGQPATDVRFSYGACTDTSTAACWALYGTLVPNFSSTGRMWLERNYDSSGGVTYGCRAYWDGAKWLQNAGI